MKDRAPVACFVVGQVVGLLPPAARQFLTRPGRYRILRPLPIEIGAEPLYHVESVTDGHQRAVEAACLEALSPLQGPAREPAAVNGKRATSHRPKPPARSSATAAVGKSSASKALPRVAAASARMAKAAKLAKPKNSKPRRRSR